MKGRNHGTIPGWDQLRHTGLLLDGPRLHSLVKHVPEPLSERIEWRLRQRAAAMLAGIDAASRASEAPRFVSWVLEEVCGYDGASGGWQRGSQVPVSLSRRAVTGERVKPRLLWNGSYGASLPVFVDTSRRVGVGRGRRVVSQVLGWLRGGNEHLAVVTNGRQWRMVFAGLDYDASCEWDASLWFEEGELAPQITALRTLLSPELWTPTVEAPSPLLQAIRDTRKGQADLSEVLGERVRGAVEILVQSHGEVLKELGEGNDAAPAADIYRAACRIAMRAVVILFAESRDLLPRGNAVYHSSYGLNGLLGQLERRAAGEMRDSFGAWPRVLALFKLVSEGSHHPDLPVTAYGGELFAAGRRDGKDGVSRALHVFENSCFGTEVLADQQVYELLRLLTRTKAKIRQGHGGMWVTVPVDFSDLSSEYIGVVYEGLLDYELKAAPPGDPVVFLSVGNCPALPLSRLEEMDDKALRNLFKELKKNSPGSGDGADDAPGGKADPPGSGSRACESAEDERKSSRTRAEEWARRAVQVVGLVKNRMAGPPEHRLAYDRKLGEVARTLVHQVVLPGEWYLARWGGTRKGSGSFYTRPGLAVPTVQRTLRPLAYDPPTGLPPERARYAPPAQWTPKLPEEILSLTVCDPACGSGSFALAALRFLTDVLYASLQHHDRIRQRGNRSLVRLLGIREGEGGDGERLSDERLPCAPDDPDFEPRLKARLRRHVVEWCIYAVDLDPLAVELCRLSLWIETMDRTLPFGFLDHKIKCGNALIGAWFDQFRHYPAMAWKNREGGDKNHSNGVHFAKNVRTRVLKAFVKDKLTPDLKLFLQGRDLFQEDLLEQAVTAHGKALAVLAEMHALPVQDAAERARRYRDLLASPAWRSLKEGMDLWCACWFWPPDQIEHAPLPTSFADPPEETRAVAEQIAAEMRFFHWELEFPDVFREAGSGFDAILGNPPWDIAKPVSKEFFSNIDPLYRSYGKQEALRKQTAYFADKVVERAWLDYNARFRAQSNFMSHAASPFGDPKENAKSQDRFTIVRGHKNHELHERWRQARDHTTRFVDPSHPFRYQGSADLNLYKLFLEAAHTLLRPGGRLGFVVPSGLYSDHGTRPLRELFLERSRWEWLFGIENRDKVFPIHRSYKFNPVIIEKGGTTEAIRTAFMHRNLDDWEHAEDLATDYTRTQVERFSPKSRAILEIQSPRDLEILEKIYANAVLLGDDGPDGWGIRYVREFDMTNDSRLFPPRPQWEAKGYRPDEYSRWLLGDWRPVEELWDEMRVDVSQPEPAEVELEDWLFDATAGSERREAEARFVHGHLLKPGDVARTDWRLRCAQPPHDRLPVPRADMPAGVTLSREGDAWIREEGVEDVALPLYEGRMIGQFDFCKKGWVSGKGRSAVWREIPWGHKQIEPQYLVAREDYAERLGKFRLSLVEPGAGKVAVMGITSSTNSRTMIASPLAASPCGNSIGVLNCAADACRPLSAILNSFACDYSLRVRLSGLQTNWFVLEETPLPGKSAGIRQGAYRLFGRLNAHRVPYDLDLTRSSIEASLPHALTEAERLRLRVILDVLIANAYSLEAEELHHLLIQCDFARKAVKDGAGLGPLNPKGFWRVDKDKDPELRHTVLTLIAFHDLEAKIEAAGGDRDRGIEAFLSQNDGEGWMLPETLRLADYGLGHDERAEHPQPVASRLGPRFYDWQLVQTADESWRECHLHARNLLGPSDYAQLIEPIHGDAILQAAEPGDCHTTALSTKPPQTEIFPEPQAELFD